MEIINRHLKGVMVVLSGIRLQLKKIEQRKGSWSHDAECALLKSLGFVL